MGLFVLDADHPVGALGDRLRQPEQVGAGVAARIAAVAVVLERMVDQLVEQFPPGAWFHGHHGDAEFDGQLHRGGRRLLDEDRGRHRPVHLLCDPADGLRVGHPEQEEQVGGTGADSQTEPDVVDVDERNRPHRHVQPARRLDQRHHGAVQREQKLAETTDPHVAPPALLCPIRL